MVNRSVITFICDLCQKEAAQDAGEIHTHTVQVDKKGADLECCKSCWAKLTKVTDKYLAAGRSFKPVPRQRVA